MKKKITKLCAGMFATSAILACTVVGCGSGESDVTVDRPELQVDKGGGGTCPVYVDCPISLPGYPTFMYAINAYGGPIACWYNNGMGGVNHVNETVPASCPVCRPPGQSDPHYNQQWYAFNWTCTAT